MKRTMVVLLLLATTAAPALSQDAAQSATDRMIRPLLDEAGILPPEGEPVKCGFPAVLHALEILRSGGGDLAQSAARILSRPTMQTSVVQGAFRVHFDTTGIHAAALLDQTGAHIPGSARAYVDSILAYLAYVHPFESTTLGYGPLPEDGTLGGGPEYDVYVMELGSMYGYTTPDSWTSEGSRATSCITIDNDFTFVRPLKNRGLPGLRVTLAHELHHTLQIANYGYWSDHAFFYEITSTWMEDVVYPDVDDYLNYLGGYSGHFRNPDKPFSSNELIMYSRSVWGHFISKKYGRDLMRACWEQIPLAPPLRAIDNALRLRGLDFHTVFAEWTLWNLFTGARSDPERYYPDGADYPLMVQIPVEYSPPSRDVSGSLAALGSRYYQVMRNPDSMTVILTNMDFAGGGTASPPSRTYAYHFRSSAADASYRLTPLGIYASLEVPDIAAWSTWFVLGDSVRRNYDPEFLVEGRSFPNPFLPGKHARVCVPVRADGQVRGTLSIYSAGMDLVYASSGTTSSLYLDRQMFFWDGNDANGRTVPSGIYVYLLDLDDRRIRGKIAVVRK